MRAAAWRGVTEALPAMGEEVVICFLWLWQDFHNMFGARSGSGSGSGSGKKLKLEGYFAGPPEVWKRSLTQNSVT